MNEMNKIITSEGNVQFQTPDGKIINVHPFHIYTVFNEDTVSFLLIAMPKSSGLAIFTSKAEDLEVDGTVYTIDELPNALSEAFAKAGAVARYEIVDELPTSGQSNTIYLVPKSEGIGYDEYIYVNGEWELIGDTDIELDRYVTKEVFSGYTADTLVLINTVSGNVITESERAISAETALQTAIDNEVSARTADVEALSGAVDNVQDEVDILSAALEDEVSARTEADTALQTLIDTVSGNVETETSRATSAETELQTAINNEASARTEADTALGNKIDGKVVELTQAEYDALVDKDPLVLYVITDASAGDLTQYWTSAQTNSAITAAVSGKQDTLISGTNIKTINNESILGSGNIDIQGGGVDVVQTTGTSTTDVMSQDAVTTQLNNKANKSSAVGGYKFGSTSNVDYLQYINVSSSNIGNSIYYPKINGKGILTSNSIFAKNNYNFQLVETSAITTSVSSSSTDAQIPSAKAVYDQLGGLKLVKLTQSEYDALSTKDSNTLYVIIN